jgi:hypothetical protein
MDTAEIAQRVAENLEVLAEKLASDMDSSSSEFLDSEHTLNFLKFFVGKSREGV